MDGHIYFTVPDLSIPTILICLQANILVKMQTSKTISKQVLVSFRKIHFVKDIFYETIKDLDNSHKICIYIDIGNSQNTEHIDNTNEINELSGKMECVHVQRIPTNTKIVLIADVDKDGANEMILGLTDRVVRSYRWSSNADLETGKLVGLNKWECTNQIGTVTLQVCQIETYTSLYLYVSTTVSIHQVM